MSNSEGLTGILRKIHPRHIIWFLLLALGALVGAQGRSYIARLDSLEDRHDKEKQTFEEYRKVQNGHLHSIDVHLEAVRGEQRTQREIITRIEKKLDGR